MPAESELLVLPQWQGYAADDRPSRGAHALASVLGRARRHAVPVPSWHPLAEPGDGERSGVVLGLPEIVDQASAALRWLDGAAPERLLVIGGDCGSDFAPIAYQAARYGGELGVLYLDAHGDLNTPASSPSHRFHGMVLRAALGDGAPALMALHARPLATAQVVMAGTRDLDDAERDFLAASGIRPWSPAAIADGRVLAAVQAHPATRWHVHLDLDVLDPADFPDVTIPTPGGPALEAVAQLLIALVAEREVVSIAVTEHIGGEPSARRIAEVLERAAW